MNYIIYIYRPTQRAININYIIYMYHPTQRASIVHCVQLYNVYSLFISGAL